MNSAIYLVPHVTAPALVPDPDKYTLIFTDHSIRTAVPALEVEPFDEAALFTSYGCWVGCVERRDTSTWRLVNDDGEIELPMEDCVLLKLDPLNDNGT